MTDRLPPHSIEAEAGVLGCILLAPNENIGLCLEKLKAGAATFYDFRHQTIFKALVEMYEARAPIALLTVTQRLKDSGQLEAAGGLSYLLGLEDAAPSAASVGYFVAILSEKYRLRQLAAVAAEILERTRGPLTGDEVDALVDDAERKVLAVRGDAADDAEAVDARALMRGAVDALEARCNGEDTALPTGFGRLDGFLGGGLRAGQLVVVAARPGVGKSAFALQVAAHVAERRPVGVFSLEMTAQEIALREIGRESGVDLRRFRPGAEIPQATTKAVTTAAGRYTKRRLYVNDTAGLSIGKLRAIARRWRREKGVELLVIDYLQLLSADRSGRDRREVVDEISRGLKLLAKELGTPVLVASQLNREMEKDKNRKPRLSDLRESGAIEQDADVVLMLYRRPDKSADGDADPDPGRVGLLIAKQRNGPSGVDVHFRFTGEVFRFEEDRPRPE